MLQAIVFDFDGVLVDSEPLHYRAFLDVSRSLGVDFDYEHYLDVLVGFDDRDAFDYILNQQASAAGTATANRTDRIAALCADKQVAFERLVGQGIEAVPGAFTLVDDVAATTPIAIASGAILRDITLMLTQLDRLDVFEVIVTADDVARSKPDPETYALAVQRLAARHTELTLRAEQCLAIEDTAAGVASAQAAGLRTLGLATTSPPDQLAQADRVVTSLEGITAKNLAAWFEK